MLPLKTARCGGSTAPPGPNQAGNHAFFVKRLAVRCETRSAQRADTLSTLRSGGRPSADCAAPRRKPVDRGISFGYFAKYE